MNDFGAATAPVIDAHHHLWDPRAAPADYAWLSGPFTALDRVFVPEDLRPDLAAAGVDGTVLVQTRSSLEESFDFLRVAAGTDFIRGVVAWVDLTSPDVPDAIAALRAAPGGGRLAGIRHQVHNEEDAEWLGRADVRRGLAAVCDAGLPYDLLLRQREMPAALDVARAMPDLAFVIDHLAKPSIATGEIDGWSALMAPIAALPNVTCKLSGLVTEADHRAWTTDDLRPYVDRVLELFGPDRLMFGSDWPVCLVAASYQRVIDTVRALIAALSGDEQAAIMSGTAQRFYGLT